MVPSAGAPAEDALAPLMARIAGRDLIALRELYGLCAPRLLGVATRLLGEPRAAEDAVQDAFVACWKGARAFDPGRSRAEAWLTALVRDRALSRRPSSPAVVPSVSAQAPSAPAVARSVEAERLGRALDALRPDQAEMIRAAYLDGLDYDALAARAGAPLGTVKSSVRRGLLRLREELAA